MDGDSPWKTQQLLNESVVSSSFHQWGDIVTHGRVVILVMARRTSAFDNPEGNGGSQPQTDPLCFLLITCIAVFSSSSWVETAVFRGLSHVLTWPRAPVSHTSNDTIFSALNNYVMVALPVK